MYIKLFEKNNYSFLLFSLSIILCSIFACNFDKLSYHILPILIIIVLLIFIEAKSRLELVIFITLYHLISARSLISGYANFFNSSFFIGIILVFIASLFFSSIIGILSFNKNKFFQLLLINIFWCFPFFIIGWSSPLFAAGYFMPGCGWLGLILFLPLIYLIKTLKCKYKVIILLIIFGLTFININKVNNINKKSLIVKSINTHFHNNIIKDSYHIYQKLFTTLQSINKLNIKKIIILPEDGIPCYNKKIKNLILKEIKNISNKIILSGATTCLNKRLKSGIILINDKNADFIYLQRQPMPYSMYMPFSSVSYAFHWNNNNGIFEFHGKKYGLFICFETVLIWTYLQTIFYKPDILLSFNSVYWDKTGKVKIIQEQLMYSMSRLFDIPYQAVWNY